MIEKHF